MKAKIFIPLLIALLFVSCTRRSETATKAVQENNEKIEECTIVFEDEFDDDFEFFVDEDFDVFFEKFKKDSVFQVSRIAFPLAITTLIYDSECDSGGVIVASTMNLEDFRFLNFHYFYTDGDVLLYIKRVSENEHSINFGVSETGISVDFTFKKEESGEWYLLWIDDRSM